VWTDTNVNLTSGIGRIVRACILYIWQAKCLYQRSPHTDTSTSSQHSSSSFTMVAKLSTLLAVLPLAAAWPAVMEMNEKMQKRAEPAPRAPLFKSGRPNTGLPPVGFNAKDQFVDVREGSGHEFKSPVQGDIRGQCPGLNAASNHGYLPHNGIANTEQSKLSRAKVVTRQQLTFLSCHGLGSGIRHGPRSVLVPFRRINRPCWRPSCRQMVDWRFLPSDRSSLHPNGYRWNPQQVSGLDVRTAVRHTLTRQTDTRETPP